MSERAQAGVVGSIAAIGTDILVNGGDFLVAGLLLVVQDGGILVTFFEYLARFAEKVAWLPAAPIRQLANVVLVLVVVLLGYRIVKNWIKNWREA